MADAATFGLDPALLEADENKALMCEGCNSGLNRLSVTTRFLVATALRLELTTRSR